MSKYRKVDTKLTDDEWKAVKMAALVRNLTVLDYVTDVLRDAVQDRRKARK